MKRLYARLVATGNFFQSPFLLLVRLFWGWSFFQAGLGKFSNLDQVAAYFQTIGIPLPMLNASVVASIEFIGGACLIIGLASRIIAIPLICTMLIAMWTAYPDAVKMVFSNPQGVMMLDPFLFFFASLIVFVFGPGAISLDRLLYKEDP